LNSIVCFKDGDWRQFFEHSNAFGMLNALTFRRQKEYVERLLNRGFRLTIAIICKVPLFVRIKMCITTVTTAGEESMSQNAATSVKIIAIAMVFTGNISRLS
jgi:hypothetical protein